MSIYSTYIEVFLNVYYLYLSILTVYLSILTYEYLQYLYLSIYRKMLFFIIRTSQLVL